MKNNIKKIFYTLPKASYQLANHSLRSGALLYLRLLYASVYWKLKGAKAKQFQFCFLDRVFTLMLHDNTDIAVLLEIYGEGEYEWDVITAPKYIVDLGANYGDTSIYFAIKYPDAIIIAVEPDPKSYKRLETHTSAFLNIYPVHAAIADSDSPVDLHLMPGSCLGNSTQERVQGATVVSVPGKTLHSLMGEFSIDGDCLLKFDIEGGEVSVFKQLANVYGIKYLLGEVHYDLITLTPKELEEMLCEFDLEIENLSQSDRVIVRASKK